jgi:hypothetical protein
MIFTNSAAAPLGGGKGSSMERELMEFERRRYKAMIEADVAALQNLLDDELIYTHSDAAIDDKASYLSKVEARQFRYETISIEEESARVLSDVALLRGRMKARAFLGDKPVTLDNRFLAVLRRIDGVWRLLCYQPTPVK